MMTRLRARLNHATIVAYLALFVALGGTAYAANEWTGANIVNESLTGADIDNTTLTGADIANGGVQNADLANDAVTTGKISDGQVRAGDIGTGAVRLGKMAADSVDGSKVLNGALTGDDVADTDSLGPADVGLLHGDSDIQDNTVSTFDIATDAVDSDEVLDFGLSNADVGVLFAYVDATGAVTESSGGATATKIGVGTYEVDFGRDISACAHLANIGLSGASSTTEGFVQTADRSGNLEAAFVQTEDQNGTNADRAFVLLEVC